MSAEVLDVCCGARMFWFDREDSRAVFMDNRSESWVLKDRSYPEGTRYFELRPQVLGDFQHIPFADSTFFVVAFDPPHLLRNGASGWQAKKYGKLPKEWQATIRSGFAECFRVLRPGGTLIFKWNEQDIPVSQILALTPERPLFGQRCGKSAKTHWIVFMKDPKP